MNNELILRNNKKKNDYLEHHGIKGMKWGVRRYQNYDGKLTAAGKKRKAMNDGNKRSRSDDSKSIKKAVKSYSKAYDKWNDAAEKAGASKEKYQQMYVALGKTRIQRIIAAAKNNTPEAKAYSKQYDKAIAESDYADELWKKTREAYKKTGKNFVDRVPNNARYNPLPEDVYND